MTETWRPAVNDEIRCIDTGYTGCDERPLLGQVGRVINFWPGHCSEIIVIKFTACKENNAGCDAEGKPRNYFNEYVSLDRGLYLYYQPANVKWGT